MPAARPIYILRKIVDNPKYRGFGAQSFRHGLFPTSKAGRWKAKKMASSWSSPPILGSVRAGNDFPCVNLIHPAFSEHASKVLREHLEPNGELLPLRTRRGTYFTYNTLTVLDALDVERSKIGWFTGRARVISHIDRHVFDHRIIAGITLFKIPQDPSSIFVDRSFVDCVLKNELAGFEFQSASCPWRRIRAY